MAQQPSVLTDGSWQDRAFVTIIRKEDQKKVDMHGLTDDFGFGDGQKDFEQTPISNGGFIRERTAESSETYNHTLYSIGSSTDTYDRFARPRGIAEFFYESGNQSEKTDVKEYTNDNTRKDYLYVVMWTDDPDVTSATDSVGQDYYAWRVINDNVQFTDVTPDFSDDVLTVETEAKRAARNPVGKPNHLEQEKVASDAEKLYRVGLDDSGSFVKYDDEDTEVSVDYF